MYKSLLGAFGLLGLLLLLCVVNPPVAVAKSTIQLKQIAAAPQAMITTTTAAITTTAATTTSTEETIQVEKLVVQNQRIIEVPASIASIMIPSLTDESFRVQTLYPLDNGTVALLATKQSADIDQEIKQIMRTAIMLRIQPHANFSLEPTFADSTLSDYLSYAIKRPTVMGNPHGVGAAPLNLPLTFDDPHDNPILKQWALSTVSTNNSGIALYDTNGTRTAISTGYGVRIILFDTSPFTFTKDPAYTGIFTTAFRIGEFPTLTIKVTNQISPAQIIAETAHHHETSPILPDVDISSHGLFAAALAYAVAPDAKIELIQVLNNRGLGTVAELTTHLRNLITDTQTNTMPTVINLSLGVLDAIEANDPDLQQLFKVITDAYQLKNVAIVASAGNLPTSTQSLALMQVPASHPAVIGVGASNAKGRMACFSKRLKGLGPRIAAPGGDAWIAGDCNSEKAIQGCVVNYQLISFLEAAYTQITGQAIPSANRYVCRGLLIGIVLDPSTHTYQYAQWMGTSFAAPIISGWVALELEKTSRDDIYRSLTPSLPAGCKGSGICALDTTGCLTRVIIRSTMQIAC